jgi:peptide-methionine (S)-S-oxide reductase
MRRAMTETAVLGGGCFWCTEAVFLEVRGVASVESGYCNGQLANPSYEAVCTGDTGHAEVVRVEFDPAVIAYRDILQIFFATHDPTTLNRQGNDVGTQYRSGIYVLNDAQAETARGLIAELNHDGVFGDAIVTEVVPLTRYYPAEAYHQRYFESNPYQGYCRWVVAPKVAKFRESLGRRFGR